jgi:hypothetical protein
MSDRTLDPLPTMTPGAYRHFKGNFYWVYGVARHSETDEPMVVYRALYGSRELWVRPYAMFTSPVDHEKYPDVAQAMRFEKVPDDQVERPVDA